jgi:hypothetical protein
MQVKPRFNSYKIIQQIPLCKDDYGNQMCLTTIEYSILDKHDILIEVISDKKEKWNNGAESYSSIAYYNVLTKELLKITIDNLLIEELEDGYHTLNNKGLRTKFKITQLNIK